MKKQPLLSALSVGLFTLGMVSNIHAAPITGQGTWESTLQGRDLNGDISTFEAYYDTTLDITWLADANYAGTKMSWASANNWAASLNPYSSGITGWRLPTMIDTGASASGCDVAYSGPDCGYNVDTATSELASMFYDTLGNLAYYDTLGNGPQPGYGLANTGPLTSFQSWGYWYGVESAFNTSNAWIFGTGTGFQSQSAKTFNAYALVVHSGDVGVSAVPVPAAVWLFGSGLLGLLGVAKRKRACL